MFVSSSATTTLPNKITVEVTEKQVNDDATVMTLTPNFEGASLEPQNVRFIQTEQLTTEGIAMHQYGALLVPTSKVATEIILEATINGKTYTNSTVKLVPSTAEVGNTIELTPSV